MDLQALDTHIAQLLHRKRTLPELADIKRLERDQEALADELVAADTRVSDLETALRRAEADLEPVRQRRTRDQERIDGGTAGDPKALRAMIEEVEHLTARIATLEDAELEVMEALETATAERAELGRRAEALEQQLATYRAARDTKVADIDAEGRGLVRERNQLAPQLPPDLLALYDKLRAAQGSGAAALRQRRCQGCLIELNAADLRAFAEAPADQVLRCEECSRILVRTPESGL
ncbi:zinc ribbon domain-containing protein [Desertihabitans aurantiacus]|uniref:zinc ribbon domain-containing protein n=1 Tax=Desertihabitans aurantiacus TaxID=2282477 RepID=UPI0018E50150|nr:C4-type zinc ribbon domain-containing protein [Desertihabitans aurantiacus]